MAKDQVFRFIVGDLNGPRSTAWRIWSHNNEVYATHPSAGGIEKLSFHTMNVCRHAITAERAREKGIAGRALAEWRRPSTPSAGSGLAIKVLSIVVPASHLTDSGDMPSRKATCLPAPSPNMATRVELMFTADNEAAFRAAATSSGFAVHTFHNLPSGENWAVASFDHRWDGPDILMPGPAGTGKVLVMPGKPTPAVARTNRCTLSRHIDEMVCVELSGFQMERAAAEAIFPGADNFERGKVPHDYQGNIWGSSPASIL